MELVLLGRLFDECHNLFFGLSLFLRKAPIDGLKAALQLVTCRPTVGNGRARHLERRQPRRGKTRQRRSPTASRSKRSSTKRQPRAPRWPTRIIFFICAKQTSSLGLIRRRSKRRRSCFMRRTISCSMSRSSKRRCKRLPRPAAQLKALRARTERSSHQLVRNRTGER
jgi:hypothetical protein